MAAGEAPQPPILETPCQLGGRHGAGCAGQGVRFAMRARLEDHALGAEECPANAVR
jgi:hypothetical protein